MSVLFDQAIYAVASLPTRQQDFIARQILSWVESHLASANAHKTLDEVHRVSIESAQPKFERSRAFEFKQTGISQPEISSV